MGRTYPSEISRVLYSPGGDVGKECRKVALEIAQQAHDDAVKVYGRHPGDRPRTGRLAKGYRVLVIPGTNVFTVTNRVPYAGVMEKGGRPHTIQARSKTSTLKFRGRDGRWRNVKIVKHPGSAPRNTLRTAARVVMRRRYGVS
jgi:hypothetical protein